MTSKQSKQLPTPASYVEANIGQGVVSPHTWDNQDLKAKLITAMESGEYVPTVGTMRRKLPSGDCFCSLGVLADILVKEGKAKWDGVYVMFCGVDTGNFHLSTVMPSEAALDSIGMSYQLANAIFKLNDGWARTAGLNGILQANPFEAVIYYLKNHVHPSTK